MSGWQGLCKIVSNEEDGNYTVTRLWWDPDADPPAYVPATGGGMVAVAGRDFLNRDGGVASDTPVRFWAQEARNGSIEILIDIASFPAVPDPEKDWVLVWDSTANGGEGGIQWNEWTPDCEAAT